MAVTGPVYNHERTEYYGLAGDTKPAGVPKGSTYWAYDTNVLYKTYDGTNWILYVTLG